VRHRLTPYIAAAILLWLFVLGLRIANGATFTLENRGSENIVMTLWWVDHNIDDQFGPAPVMCADLEPAGTFIGSSSYEGHRFAVHAYNNDNDVLIEFYVSNVLDHNLMVWDGERIKIE
jgi:hypothetical protein